MSRSATWSNGDGLVVGFGTHTADDNVPGVTGNRSGIKMAVVQIVGTELVDTFAATNVKPQSVTLRRGSRIINASLIVQEAFTGLVSLDIGTWGTSYNGVAVDAVDVANGIDSAVLLAALGVGVAVACDGTLVNGALTVGATSNSDCVISYAFNTAATAGRATLYVQYVEPQHTETFLA